VILADGTAVSGAVELAAHLIATDDFGACMSKAWLSYALQNLSETLCDREVENTRDSWRAPAGSH